MTHKGGPVNSLDQVHTNLDQSEIVHVIQVSVHCPVFRQVETVRQTDRQTGRDRETDTDREVEKQTDRRADG